MPKFPSYAGLSPVNVPFVVHRLMRKIGSVFGPSKILRTTDNLGEGAFEDGAKLVGAVSRVELYKPSNIQDWAVHLAAQLEPSFAEQPRSFQARAAACVSAVLGIDGQDHADELILWMDPKDSGPQYWGVRAAQDFHIPVHDLANATEFKTWKSWGETNTPNMSLVKSEDSA